MLIEQTIEKLHQMKLNAMATALREQMGNADYQSLSFEDRLSLLVDRQFDEKESRALTRRLQVAKLKQPAAIANKACRCKLTVRYFRTGGLLSAVALGRGDGSYPRLARSLQKTDLLVLDDWGLYPLDAQAAREIFEILEDRSGSGSTMIVSQIPVTDWFAGIAAPTIADPILDRLVHGAYRIEMTGESMRKKLSALTQAET